MLSFQDLVKLDDVVTPRGVSTFARIQKIIKNLNHTKRAGEAQVPVAAALKGLLVELLPGGRMERKTVHSGWNRGLPK